jgi:two-component system phosphate regulon response regulator PhoB
MGTVPMGVQNVAFFMQRILLVHGEAAIRDIATVSLAVSGYELLFAESSQDAHDMIVDGTPDLVLLDWMLSGTMELLRRLKRNESLAKLPVVILTAKAEDDNTVAGLDSGADDFIARPFSPQELLSRVKAVLQRSRREELTAPVKIDALVFDPISYRVTIDGMPINLGPTEYRLLQFFLTNQERVHSRNQILEHVWRGNVSVDERTVDVHIQRLRKAMSVQAHDKYIQTVRGAGYRFSTQIVGS